MAEAVQKPKKKREMLTSFSIMFILLAAIAVIAWLVSLTNSAVKPISFGDLMMSPVRGFVDGMGVALFVLVLGGFLGIVNKTNALNTGIAALVRKMGGNELKLIPILMLVFAIMGSTYGFCEETVGFYALLAATMMAAGFDALTGAMMILLGAGVGCLGSTVNPFATGIASSALTDMGIAVDQGVVIGVGLVLLLTSYLIAVAFTMAYAKRVKADPSRSLMSADEQAEAQKAYGDAADRAKKEADLTKNQKAVLWLFGLAFLIMIIGFIPWEKLGIGVFDAGHTTEEVTTDVTGEDIEQAYKQKGLGTLELQGDVSGHVTEEEDATLGWSAYLTGAPLGDWYFDESTTWFLLMAILIGIVAGFSEKEIVDTFMAGAGDMMGVVMIVGLSRGVSILMGQTGLSEFVLNSAAGALQGTSAGVFATGSYIMYFLLSILISGTSSMANISMPIMGPLTQSLGFNPAVMISIFAAASGVVNYFTPTNGAIMGGLALARVEYSTWMKICVKIVVVTAVANIVVLAIAMAVL